MFSRIALASNLFARSTEVLFPTKESHIFPIHFSIARTFCIKPIGLTKMYGIKYIIQRWGRIQYRVLRGFSFPKTRYFSSKQIHPPDARRSIIIIIEHMPLYEQLGATYNTSDIH